MTEAAAPVPGRVTEDHGAPSPAGTGEALPSPAEALAEAFRAVHAERMQGLPMVNDALRVEAVGFAPWREHWLGVLVTPWFINLVLMPRLREHWRGVRLGDSRSYAFPAGVFEFIGGHDERVGEFQSCSLFSPVFEFQDQESARITARCALQALFDEANRESPAFDVSPDAPAAAQQRTDQDVPPGPASDALPAAPAPAPLSKRAFLRAEFLDAGRRDRG
jgi:[NiFe] hydrogenase assembly HybE family chaperone